MTLTNLILTRACGSFGNFMKSFRHHGRNKLSYSSSPSTSVLNKSKRSSISIAISENCHNRVFTPNNVILRCFAVGFTFRHDENLNAVRLLYQMPNYKSLLFQAMDTADVEQLLETQVLQRASKSNPIALKVQPTQTWRKSVVDFIEASYSSQEAQLPVTHPKNEEIVKAVLKDLKSLSDEELSQILYHLRFFGSVPHSKDPNYQKIWQSLDSECRSRGTSWSIDYNFVIADLWYGIGLARLSEFHWYFLRRLFRRCDKLSREHFVRFMFCLNLNRSIPPDFSPYDLEYRLSKIADQLNPAEVVILAMAFFKIQIPVRDGELVKKLLKIVMKESDTLDSIAVAAVAKFARYSSHSTSTADVIFDFQQKFIPEIARLSITACTHIALTGTNNLNPHKEVVKTVVNRIERNMTEARLKELERVALAATMFNVDCDNLMQLLAEELQRPERADEIRKYGRCLPAILHYLSIKEIFIPDLISTVLSKTFRNTYYGKGKEIFQRELLCLDIAADIELPEYNGHRLEPKIFDTIMKKNMLWIKHSSKVKIPIYEKFLRAVIESAEEVLGDKEFFSVCNILPQHHTMAIVYCRDLDGQLAKIPQYFTDLQPYEIKKIQYDSTKLSYYALMVCGRNTYLLKSKELTGQANLQLRQAKKLGYKTNLVRYSDWEEMGEPLKLTKHIEAIINNEGEI